jgi:peptide/nickel transport system permease protein
MARYLAGRLFRIAWIMLGVVTVVFLLLRLSGDPISAVVPPDATTEMVEELRRVYGFDQPLAVQYVSYLSGIVRGDFGESFQYSRPALEVVLDRVGATMLLASLAMVLALTLALPIGFLCARYRNSFLDHALMTVAVMGNTMPTFLVGIVLILVFGLWLGIAPTGGSGGISHAVLPVVTISFATAASLARMTRSEVLETLAKPYVRTARAKRLPRMRLIVAHVLKNAAIPIVTVAGLQFGALLSGAIVTETVFGWPGLGTLVLEAIGRRDYSVVQAVVCVTAFIFVVLNAITDVIYQRLDPRISVA